MLPPPYATPSVANFATVVGWPEGRTPQAPQGFEVTLVAELPDGSLLLADDAGDCVWRVSRR